MARIRLTNAPRTKVKGFESRRYTEKRKIKKVTSSKRGAYKYVFQTYCDKSKEYSSPKHVRFDTFQEAKYFVMSNTPAGYQGLLDGESIFAN